jgi:hypothetical protein
LLPFLNAMASFPKVDLQAMFKIRKFTCTKHFFITLIYRIYIPETKAVYFPQLNKKPINNPNKADHPK